MILFKKEKFTSDFLNLRFKEIFQLLLQKKKLNTSAKTISFIIESIIKKGKDLFLLSKIFEIFNFDSGRKLF